MFKLRFYSSFLQELFGFGTRGASIVSSTSTARELRISIAEVDRILDLCTSGRGSPYLLHSWTDHRRRKRILRLPNLTKAYRRWMHGLVNFCVVRDLFKAVKSHCELLIANGHVNTARLAGDKVLIVDMFSDAKSTGMAGLSGYCLFFGLHFLQCDRAQDLTSMLPIAVQLGSDGTVALRSRLFSSSRLGKRLKKINGRRIRLPCGTVVRVKLTSSSDFKEVSLLCDVAPANIPFPKVPQADDSSDADDEGRPQTQWFTAQQAPWSRVSPADMYRLRAHPDLDLPHIDFSSQHGLSPSRIFMGPFHAIYNLACGFFATLCRWLHRGPLSLPTSHEAVSYLQRVFSAVGADDGDGDSTEQDYRWDPLRSLSEAERRTLRTTSLHRALPTLVLRSCANDRHWKRVLLSLRNLIPMAGAQGPFLTMLMSAIVNIRNIYLAYKGELSVLDLPERIGHVTWEIWMRMVRDITPPPSLPARWDVEIDPRGSAAGPSSCFFLTNAVRFLRRRGPYANASWEVVGEHYLKRIMLVFNNARIGLNRHGRRPRLLMRLLIAYAIADACTSAEHPARKQHRRATECQNYVTAPIKVRHCLERIALV